MGGMRSDTDILIIGERQHGDQFAVGTPLSAGDPRHRRRLGVGRIGMIAGPGGVPCWASVHGEA